MTNSNLWPPQFYAYLPNRRSADAIRKLLDDLQIAAFNQKDDLVGYQYDIMGAFDNLSKNYTYACLKLLNFGPIFITRLKNMSANTIIKILYQNFDLPPFNQTVE